MAWYNFWREKRSKQPNEPYQTPVLYSDGLQSGIFTQIRSSRASSAVFACVNLISNSLSCMDLRVMSEDSCGHREIVKHHPLQRIFKNKVVMTLSIKQIIKNVMEDVLLKGEGFVYVVRGESGLVTSLRYIPRSNMNVMYDQMKDTLYYQTPLLGNRKLPARDVIHIKDITRDGVNGMSVLLYAKNSIELANRAENAANDFFEQKCNISGILSPNVAVNDEQREKMKRTWSREDRLHVLPFGVTYQQIGVDASKAQMLETRQYEAVEICRFFGVNPMLIQDMSHSSYNTLEQVNLQFLQYTLMPFVKEIEDEFTRKVFVDSEDLIVDMDENSFLLRTDKQSTGEYYTKMVQSGIYSVNDARRELGLSEISDGDTHTVAFTDASKANLANSEADKNKVNNDGEDIPKPTDGTE